MATMLSAGSHAESLGFWSEDGSGLPTFEYTGALPYSRALADGTVVRLNEDPWFLLGNYRLTLFTHVSGQYQLISGQRSWARVNQGEDKISGLNRAVLTEVSSTGYIVKEHSLTGLDSVAADPTRCRRVFGCGYAHYEYQLDDTLSCRRKISIQPSANPRGGISAFVVDIEIENRGDEVREFQYSEAITANYNGISMHPGELDAVRFENRISEAPALGIIKTDFAPHSDDPLMLVDREEMALVDTYAPSLFMYGGRDVELDHADAASGTEMSAVAELEIPAGETRSVRVVIGISFERDFEYIDSMVRSLLVAARETIDGLFEEEWSRVLPDFPQEEDEVLHREMVWNAYNLEAMATYSEFYDETKVPQGTIYDYSWGLHASARDNFQHALPLCYSNPELAKSVLRYMMKRTNPMGEILLLESGNGFCSNKYYQQSDNQINYFKLISEFLRITGDYEFLKEEVSFFPVKDMPTGNSIDFMERCFLYLRDQVGTGSHGLVKMLNADWNDAVFYMEKEAYNRVIFTGESHMNTTMVLSIFEKLIPTLESLVGKPEFAAERKRIARLVSSMKHYFDLLEKAFYEDLGEDVFTKRIYFNNKAYGDTSMYLEAQGYMLQLESLPLERKKQLYQAMVERVYAGEKMMAREQEEPIVDDEAFEYGSRENGGVWYSLNGPIINGLAGFDKVEALKRLKMMGFDHAAKSFPEYWSAYWSGPDNLESSLIPAEGLPDQTWTYWEIPVYCAHPHAWSLYCYYKLNEEEK